MHVLFGDETNTEPARDVEFFIYGALVLSEEQIVEVHDGVDGIRQELALEHNEPLKFSYKPRRVTPDEHREAKAKHRQLFLSSFEGETGQDLSLQALKEKPPSGAALHLARRGSCS